jgi:succinate-semialdehyde dehydrogenase/glutarate-semialdehyde dehydrogenase
MEPRQRRWRRRWLQSAAQKALHLPHATASDLDAALAAADKGFKLWKAKSAYDRGRIIKKAADLLRERADEIARSMSQEQGKVLAEAKGEVITSADIVEWFAEEGRRAYGRIIPSRNPTVRQMVVTEPVGVVAAFTPWNFPVLRPQARGRSRRCSIIIKASEETPGAASSWYASRTRASPASSISCSACRRKSPST